MIASGIALAVVAALVATFALTGHSGGGSSSGAAGQSPSPTDTRPEFAQALDALAAEPALHFVTATDDRTVTSRGEEIGTTTVDGTKIPVLTVDGVTYVKPPASVIASFGSDAESQALQGRWIVDAPGLSGPSYAWGAPPALASLLSRALAQTPVVPPLGDPGTTVGGTPALKASTPAGDLYISKDAPHHVLRFVPSAGSTATPSTTAKPSRKRPFGLTMTLILDAPANGPPREAQGDDASQADVSSVDGQGLDSTITDLTGDAQQLADAPNPGLQLTGSTDVSCSAGGCTATVQVTPSISTDTADGGDTSVTAGPVHEELTAQFTVGGTSAPGCTSEGDGTIDATGSISCSQPADGPIVSEAISQAQEQAQADGASSWQVPYSAQTYVMGSTLIDVQKIVDGLTAEKAAAQQPKSGKSVPRAVGSQQGADVLAQRAKSLQQQYEQATGDHQFTVAEVKVQNKETGQTQTWVATSSAKTPAALAPLLAPGEVPIQGGGHAEQTIIDHLYDVNGTSKDWEIVEGGTSWNVCIIHKTGICAPGLWSEGLTIDGTPYPWRQPGFKTDYRTFWFPGDS